MKELSIEEKAKAYDQAIKVAKSKIKNDKDHVLYEDDIKEIFPELKEREDVKMKNFIYTELACLRIVNEKGTVRYKELTDAISWLEKQGKNTYNKELSDLLHKVICRFINDPDIPYSDREKVSMKVLPYVERLEKQGEQEHVIAPKFDIGDTIRNKITNEVFTITDRCLFLEYYHNINHLHEIKFSEQDNWELVKQKPADKIEPKFKVGDWVVVNDGRIGKIIECTKDFVDVDLEFSHLSTRVNNIRSWTIEDAKDGDVLCYKDEISLYRHDIKNCTKQETTFGGFVYHCCYDGNWFITDSLYSLTEQDKMDIHPATKEQRDLLFQKMRKKGYEWDAENKELKKIEQKSAWSEEDEDNRINAIKYLELFDTQGIHGDVAVPCIEWLKCLKDRVQPKQEVKKLKKIMVELIKINFPDDKAYLIDENVKAFADIVGEMTRLYAKKNHDYGDSFDKGMADIGTAYGIGRLYDKMNRIITLTKVKAEVNDESIEDTLKDLACYSVMMLSYIKRKNNK